MESLLKSNIYFLEQAERLLIKISDQDYCCTIDRFYGSTLGQHVRHCLDHYHSLFGGLEGALVDYDRRARDEGLEVSTELAIAEIATIRDRLSGLFFGELSLPLRVKMDCGGGEQEWQRSTLGRELQFLVSHTVHHFALIGGMCRCLGIETEEGFGVAPSTLRQRENVQND
jgi:hypothetical protein